MMSPKISVILLNYNQEEHTRECIRSLRDVTYPNLEIVLIDNASRDGSGGRLKNAFPDVVYHGNRLNLGFSGGNNVGVRIALERGAEYVMLLNNDTVVDKDFLDPLLRAATADPSIGCQSGKILFYSDPGRIWYAGGIIDVDKALGLHRGMHEADAGQYDLAGDTGFNTGCMMFTSRAVIERVGMLDESLFCYFEDMDWCLRARSLGYRMVYNPAAIIRHKVSVTSKIDSPVYLYFTSRNKILILRKHSSLSHWLWHVPYFIYYYLRHILRLSLKWRSYEGTKAVVAGVIDGLRNFTGMHGAGRFTHVLGEQ